ncbi:MAG: AIM24 family protein [Planctomycetia bacterium]|nr:AIM24 family protein [Planctomycetia bacterium]
MLFNKQASSSCMKGITMADFTVHQLEGTRYVEAHLNHESVRLEAGSLCYMTGDISVYSPVIPSMGGLITSVLADEAMHRPVYSGTGIITMESSLGGFHVLQLNGESWILERGAYWASEGSIKLSYHREPIMTAIWAGEGFIYLQTKVSGYGKVVVCTKGPTEIIQLEKGKKFVAEGRYVICRTGDVSFKIKRLTKNYLGRYSSGEKLVREYEGTGKILLNPGHYWRYSMKHREAIAGV